MPDIGLNTWLYCSFPTWTPSYTLERAIEHVGRNGYDTIELGAASPHAWPPYMTEDRIATIQRALDDSDLDVASVCPALGGGPGPNPASPLETERAAARKHYLGCLDVAEAFDAPTVIWVGGWHLGDQHYDDAWANMRGVLADVADEAETRDLTIAIEATPADSNLIDTPDDQLRLLDEVDADSLGVMFDTYHALIRGDSPTRYVNRLEDHLVHIHLADTDRLPPGDGEHSFRPMLDRLVEIGYDGPYIVEIFGDHLDPDEAAWNAQQNLASMLDAVEPGPE
jgi:protein FrlC